MIIKRLDQLQRGEFAAVERIDGNHSVARRLMEMALLPGANVALLGAAPFGDPLMFQLDMSCISVRRKDAACVVVRL